jgi:serine protease Do
MLLVCGLLLLPPAWAADSPDSISAADLERIFAGDDPQSLEELRAMERHQRELSKKLMACTVGIVVGPAHGSGVIVSEDGYVLTAAHVIGAANRTATVILSDGRRVRAKTLGAFRTLDAGLLKITDKGPWPHAEMAKEGSLRLGQWCVATGHPGGYQDGRTPVVRVGRILLTDRFAITTDCTLVGGDSGGPLFDMQGRVIGINSRIGRFLTANMHVPVEPFQQYWERMVSGEHWGSFPGTGPYLGVQGVADAADAKIAQVYAGSPAEKAGLKAGDVIVGYNGKPVADFGALQLLVNESQPGDRVKIEVRRGDQKRELDLVVGKQPEQSTGQMEHS